MTLFQSFTRCAMNVSGAIVAAGCLSQSAAADSITTLFNSNNSLVATGTVYFDIAVGANPILITGFDTNVTAVATGLPVPFRAWTALGTSLGNQTNPLAWTLVATGAGVGAGLNNPTSIALDGSFMLNANTSYGMALALSDGTGVNNRSFAYSGTGTNPAPGLLQYSNADVTLNLGTATTLLFGGSVVTPRIWNGTIHYTVVPAPGAVALLGLAGLMGGPRRRRG